MTALAWPVGAVPAPRVVRWAPVAEVAPAPSERPPGAWLDDVARVAGAAGRAVGAIVRAVRRVGVERAAVVASSAVTLAAGWFCVDGLLADASAGVLGRGMALVGLTVALAVLLVLGAGRPGADSRICSYARGHMSGDRCTERDLFAASAAEIRRTVLHEAAHGAMAKRNGARVISMYAYRDGSGVTHSTYASAPSALARAAQAYAGGLGGGDWLGGHACSFDRATADRVIAAAYPWSERPAAHAEAKRMARSVVCGPFGGPSAAVQAMARRVKVVA